MTRDQKATALLIVVLCVLAPPLTFWLITTPSGSGTVVPEPLGSAPGRPPLPPRLPPLDPPPAPLDPPTTAAPDPLADLNTAFRTHYRNARIELLVEAGPVIIVSGDDVILRYGGKREEKQAVPRVYDALKAVAHVPLAIYVLLLPNTDGPLSPDRLPQLHDYRRQVETVRQGLEEKRFPAGAFARQQKILSDSLAFLDGVLERKQSGHDELQAFTRKMAPLVLANAADSAQAQLDALHVQVTAWRKAKLTDDEWKRLHVIIVGSQMPRKENLAVQYFARLLGEPGEGKRIVYAEALWDENKALDLLGTHFLDTDIGADFFNDGRRMHRDLLADAAREYIQKMKFDP